MSSGIYNKFTGYHNRRSIRLKGYDYSRSGYYYVTICTHDRKEKLFGKIIDGKMIENEFGRIIRNELTLTEQLRPNVEIYEFVIMPNHVHIIFHINDIVNKMNNETSNNDHVGAYCNTPLHEGNTPLRCGNTPLPCRNTVTNENNASINNRDNPSTCTTENNDQSDTQTRNNYLKNLKSPSKTIGSIVRGIKAASAKQINITRDFFGVPVWQRNYYEHIIRDKNELYFIRKYIQENPHKWAEDINNHVEIELKKIECGKFY